MCTDADKQNMTGADGSPAFNRIYVDDWKGTLDEAKAVFLGPHVSSANAMVFVARRAVVFGDVFGKERFVTIPAANLAASMRKRVVDTRNSLVAFQSDKLNEINSRTATPTIK